MNDNGIDLNAKRRAEIRRHKIMSQRVDRIEKILSNQRHNNYIESKDESVLNENNKKSQPICDEKENQKTIDLINELSNDERVRHRFNRSVNGMDSQSFESSSEQQLVDRTFPRKVSLISTPIDYKTLQQSHQNNTTSLLSQFVWVLALNPIQISVNCFLIFVAIIGSLFKFNFIFPFLLTQIFRLLIIWRNIKYNGFNKTINKFSIFISVSQQLTLFVFTYIVVQLFI
jgi:hypothetical protein